LIFHEQRIFLIDGPKFFFFFSPFIKEKKRRGKEEEIKEVGNINEQIEEEEN
jgi:hypothetical protein